MNVLPMGMKAKKEMLENEMTDIHNCLKGVSELFKKQSDKHKEIVRGLFMKYQGQEQMNRSDQLGYVEHLAKCETYVECANFLAFLIAKSEGEKNDNG